MQMIAVVTSIAIYYMLDNPPNALDLIYLVLTVTLWSRHYYYLFFIDVNTKAQKG